MCQFSGKFQVSITKIGFVRKIAQIFFEEQENFFPKIRVYCLSLFPGRFFSQRKLDFNGFLGGGGGAPVWGHYFKQHLLSFHPICLVAHTNVWLCTVPGCLMQAGMYSCFMGHPTARCRLVLADPASSEVY